jgi:hypothetical protein
MATLELTRLYCMQTATAFGDDIELIVDGEPVGGQFNVNQGESKDLRKLTPFSFPDYDH